MNQAIINPYGFEEQQASPESSFLKLCLFGVSGAGKTYSALRIATGIQEVVGGDIYVLDSEYGRSEKYGRKFNFKVIKMDARDVDEMIAGIKYATEKGASVIIVDSMTHAWYELLEQVDTLGDTKYRGFKMGGWTWGTPKQKELIDALLKCEAHLIGTMRSKTEWTMELNAMGKQVPKRVGIKPQQGKDIEYEFDMLMSLNQEHVGFFEKDITGHFQDKTIKNPDEEFGIKLVNWLIKGLPEKGANDQLKRTAQTKNENKLLRRRSWEN